MRQETLIHANSLCWRSEGLMLMPYSSLCVAHQAVHMSLVLGCTCKLAATTIAWQDGQAHAVLEWQAPPKICVTVLQVSMLGAAQPGARLKLLVQALTSPSLASRGGAAGSTPVPEELQVCVSPFQASYVAC